MMPKDIVFWSRTGENHQKSCKDWLPAKGISAATAGKGKTACGRNTGILGEK